ncbi:MAG: SDR family oxidoreductase [Thermoleophilaceae bacterium]
MTAVHSHISMSLDGFVNARFEFVESVAKLGRVATPEDVVACAIYLASDESSVVTGTEIVVGGGNILLGPQLEEMSG